MTVTNPSFASGGDSQETDASLRTRARLFFLQARRGTLGAIEFGALSIDGIRQATAEEVVDSTGNPIGPLNLFIADARGRANSIVIEQVRVALLEYRCGGIIVDIWGAIPAYVEIKYRLRFQSNTDTSAAFDQIRQITLSRINELAPNQSLERSLLFEIARSVRGVIVRNDALVEPAGDIIPERGQILRTRPDLVSLA